MDYFASGKGGWASLKGKSSTERAIALIVLANPQFRDVLAAAAGSVT